MRASASPDRVPAPTPRSGIRFRILLAALWICGGGSRFIAEGYADDPEGSSQTWENEYVRLSVESGAVADVVLDGNHFILLPADGTDGQVTVRLEYRNPAHGPWFMGPKTVSWGETFIYQPTDVGGTIETHLIGEVALPVLELVTWPEGDETATDELRIAKWEHAFTPGTLPTDRPIFAPDFLDRDGDNAEPDRFAIRLRGYPGTHPLGDGEGPEVAERVANLLTSHEIEEFENPRVEITLRADPGTGIYRSRTMILVSNEADDEERHIVVKEGAEVLQTGAISEDEHGEPIANNAKDDRTHRAGLGGTVSVTFTDVGDEEPPDGGDPVAGVDLLAEAQVPVRKQVEVNMVLVRDQLGDLVVSNDPMRLFFSMRRTQEVFAQTGISVEFGDIHSVVEPMNYAPPFLVLTDDGFVHPFNDHHVLQPSGATVPGHVIHIVMTTPGLKRSENMGKPTLGMAWIRRADLGLLENVPEDYRDNAFVAFNPQHVERKLDRNTLTIAHELGHLLLDLFGHKDERWRLMYDGTQAENAVTDTVRLTSSDQTTMDTSPQVKDPQEPAP